MHSTLAELNSDRAKMLSNSLLGRLILESLELQMVHEDRYAAKIIMMVVMTTWMWCNSTSPSTPAFTAATLH